MSYQLPDYITNHSGTPFEIPEIAGARVVSDNPMMGGRQVVVKFANGYGASVINHFGAYGGLELAVLDSSGELTYDTPVTADVVGHLTQETLNLTLKAIAELESAA